MSLDVARTLALSTAITRTYNPDLRVLGLTSSPGDGARVELLLRLAGCHEGECLVMVNVGRASEAELAVELPEALRRALDEHTGSSGSYAGSE